MVRFSVGDVTITRIEEMNGPGMKPEEIFRHFDPAMLDACPDALTPDLYHAKSGRLFSSIHSWLIEIGGQKVLVDTASGNDKDRPGLFSRFDHLNLPWLENLKSAGVEPEDIDIVFCTHLHVDHVGWNTRLDNGRWVPTFPNARYVFAKSEFDYWTGQNAKAPVAPFGDSVLPVVEAQRADIVGQDFRIGDHVRLMPTPGHTPGHVAIAFGRGRDDAVMTGDLIHSPLQARYPELSAKFDVDPAQAASTRRSFLEHYCDSDTLCCFAHFPSPSAGRVKRWGDGFRCDAFAAA